MRVVVTGALGHIGSQLIRELPSMEPDIEIVMVDNLATQRYCSLFHLPTEGCYRFLEEDILDAELCSVFAQADVVVHLAAITDATSSFENKEKVEKVNFLGTKRVAEACQQVGCALIFPSTTSVYGSQADIVDEDCPVRQLRPQSPYAESKLRSEQLLHELGTQRALRFAVCRFGTIFGTSMGMRYHTAINRFCWQAVMGQSLTVWQTALHQYRPYLDLSDCIEALKFIIRRELYHGQVYNIVTINETVNTIVDTIAAYVPDVSIEYVSNRIMNQLSYHVSNTRFQALGFNFRGDLEQAIGRTIDMLKSANQRSEAWPCHMQIA